MPDIRERLRRQRDFPAADAVRDALTAAGVRVNDEAGATRWTV